MVEQFDEQLFNRNSAMVGLEKISHTPKRTKSFAYCYMPRALLCAHISRRLTSMSSLGGGPNAF